MKKYFLKLNCYGRPAVKEKTLANGLGRVIHQNGKISGLWPERQVKLQLGGCHKVVICAVMHLHGNMRANEYCGWQGAPFMAPLHPSDSLTHKHTWLSLLQNIISSMPDCAGAKLAVMWIPNPQTGPQIMLKAWPVGGKKTMTAPFFSTTLFFYLVSLIHLSPLPFSLQLLFIPLLLQ